MHQPWRSLAAIINKCLSGKTTGLERLRLSRDGVDTLLKVPGEQPQKKSGTAEGAGDKPEVPNVPKYNSNSEEESWTFSDGDDDEDVNEESDAHDDSDENESDDKDQRVHTPPDYHLSEKSENQEDYDAEDGEEYSDEEMLYGDLNLSRLTAKLILTITLTTFPTITLPEIPNFVSLFGFDQRVTALESELSMLKKSNPFTEAISSIPGIVDKYLATKMKEAVDVVVQLKSDKLREEAQAENQDFIKSLDSNMTKIIKQQVKVQTSKIMLKLEKYVTDTLGAEVLVRSTNQPQTSYAVASSLLELKLKKNLMDKMEESKAIDRSEVQKNLYNALVEAYNTNKDIISTYGDVVTISRGQGDEDKDEEPFAGSNRGTKRRRSYKETKSTNEPTHKESRTTSYSRGASKSQLTDLDDSTHQEFNTGDEDVIPTTEAQDERQWHPSSSPTPDHEWHLTKTVSNLPPQPWITHLAQAAGLQSLFDKLMATHIDFSAFMMNRLKIDYLTQELLTGPTYDLMKGSCKSVTELEYHLEEVFKATNDQLEGNNPEGMPYPHDLIKPLPLIPNARGRLVIPFDHFINNDLEYLKGESLSHKYTTSITKTMAVDYGQIKWIKDRIPRSMWSTDLLSTINTPIGEHINGVQNVRDSMDMLPAWKLQRIHLEEITVRRQDDKLYKLRECDFKRLRRQDIKDKLPLLVQGKLTNLSLDQRYALNVALRMYIHRIVIQERVEDLQLPVKSYQKKINLSRPDSKRLDLRKMTPYTAYPNIQGIIYQDDMNRNRLMRTDELYKFSDATLNHVRTALNDIATGIQIEYLPKRL
ncbi:hypothetical protein Tco_0843203 [Tanacetum coccineum]|uniref:Uncharacterized protein n=1 Tax=Tanacetum coccineum TaxID=301880 RepID=A0ABQ5B2B4_9ASTR